MYLKAESSRRHPGATRRAMEAGSCTSSVCTHSIRAHNMTVFRASPPQLLFEHDRMGVALSRRAKDPTKVFGLKQSLNFV
jgi:hypothetical protein